MPFHFLKANFNGDPNVGMYGIATDRYCLLGLSPEKLVEKITKTLGVEVKVMSVAQTELIGLFAAGNSNGLVVTNIAEKDEIKDLKKMLGINVLVIGARETTIGNHLLCNDRGAIIPAGWKRYKEKIAETLGVEVEIGTVAGLEIVGSAAAASNVGVLCHSAAKEAELQRIQEILKIRNADVGTVGFGSPYLRSGLLVNSHGAIVADTSTGPELGRIGEVFGEE